MIDLKRFIASMSKCTQARELGLSFAFLDLSLKVGGNQKQLLRDVTGRIDSGSMWGIMGASGAGKCKRETSPKHVDGKLTYISDISQCPYG